jgi:hypothetical protein
VSSGFQSPTSKFLVHAWSDIFRCCQGPICRSPSLRPASPLSNSCICTCSEALFSHYSLYTYTLLWYLPCSSLSLLPGLVFSIASCDRLTSLSTPNSHLDTRHLAFSRLLLPLSYRDPVFSVSQPWRRRYINHTAHASSLLSSTHNNSSLLPSTSLLSLTIQVDKPSSTTVSFLDKTNSFLDKTNSFLPLQLYSEPVSSSSTAGSPVNISLQASFRCISIFKCELPVFNACLPSELEQLFAHQHWVSALHSNNTSSPSLRVAAACRPLLPLATHRRHSKSHAHLLLLFSNTYPALPLLLDLSHLPSTPAFSARASHPSPLLLYVCFMHISPSPSLFEHFPRLRSHRCADSSFRTALLTCPSSGSAISAAQTLTTRTTSHLTTI